MRIAIAAANGDKNKLDNVIAKINDKCAEYSIPEIAESMAPEPKIKIGMYKGKISSDNKTLLLFKPIVKAEPIAPMADNAGVPNNKDKIKTHNSSPDKLN